MAKGPHSLAQGSTLEPSIAPDTIPIASGSRELDRHASAPAYIAFLIVVLSAEVIAYYRFSNSTAILMRGGFDVRFLLLTLTEWIRYMIMGAAATTILLSRKESAALAMRLLIAPVPISSRKRILAIQVMLAGALVAWSALSPDYFASPHAVATWGLVRIALAIGAIVAFAIALIPLEVWREWYFARPGALRVGVAVGLVAGPVLRNFLPMLSSAMCEIPILTAAMYDFTIWIAAATLRALGQHSLINWQRQSIEVPGFRVIVSPQCAGIDGIVVITLFLAAYLWFCRRDLRFPVSLILLPLGVILSWILNDVRLTALIMIGQHNPKLAIGFFHTIAGWAFLNLLGIAMVVSSRTMTIFRAEPLDAIPRAREQTSSADMYIVPMLVTLAVGMLTRPFVASLDFLYPITVIATAAVLLAYRGKIIRLGWSPDWTAPAAGVVVFAIWIAIARWSGTLSDPAMAAALRGLPEWERYGWIVFRVAGAVISVPIAEELFFRGYLLRKLVSADFDSVDPRCFTWMSFLISSIIFGLLHKNWIGGIVAGMAFAIAQYRRGRLSDAIVAHSACNALVAAYVIATGSWGLWN
jgi:exosortase E/protease (VPEID-CTERM system)